MKRAMILTIAFLAMFVTGIAVGRGSVGSFPTDAQLAEKMIQAREFRAVLREHDYKVSLLRGLVLRDLKNVSAASSGNSTGPKR